MVPSSHCVVLTLYVTIFLSHLVVSFIFFFNGFIFTLCNSLIFGGSFVTFGGSPFFFFSYLIVQFTHCVVLTLYVTVLLSHLVVLSSFFFSHLTISFLCYAVSTSHVTVFLSNLGFIFFLIFDNSILTLCSTNITCDCTFLTSFIFFFHI